MCMVSQETLRAKDLCPWKQQVRLCRFSSLKFTIQPYNEICNPNQIAEYQKILFVLIFTQSPPGKCPVLKCLGMDGVGDLNTIWNSTGGVCKLWSVGFNDLLEKNIFPVVILAVNGVVKRKITLVKVREHCFITGHLINRHVCKTTQTW